MREPGAVSKIPNSSRNVVEVMLAHVQLCKACTDVQSRAENCLPSQRHVSCKLEMRPEAYTDYAMSLGPS